MKITVSFHGGEELAATLNSLPSKLSRKVITDALKVAGEPMRARMAQLAPHEPGAPDLKANMVISVSRQSARHRGEHSVAVGPQRDFGPRSFVYPTAQEFGTIHHAAQPYARPAFESMKGTSLNILGQELWNGLRKALSTSFPAPGGIGGRFV